MVRGLYGSDMRRSMHAAKTQMPKIWQRNIVGRGNIEHKDFEVGTRLVCLRNTEQHTGYYKTSEEKVLDEEVRKVDRGQTIKSLGGIFEF